MSKAIFKKIFVLLLFAAVALAEVLGTIYVGFDIDDTSIGTGTEESFDLYIDSIRTEAGGVVYSAGECLHEYQTFWLRSSGRQIANIAEDSICRCTGSSCYRSYYTHSSPADLYRDVVSSACYFLVSDSLDSAYAFSPSRYSFVVLGYRPGNVAISLSEKFTTTDYDEWSVVSDTMELTIVGPPIECVPLLPPECLEVYNVTPLAAKGIWHHVMLHDGYQYSISPSATPPVSGIDLDTNYISISGLAPETNYYLHARAWANCESSGRTYSDWSSVSFNTLPQPETMIRTSPAGLFFYADSALYDSTTIFLWPYYASGGPCHWLEAVSPQYGEPGGIYFFREWSDGGAYGHCYYVTSTNTTITCYFDSISAEFVSQTPLPSSICAGATFSVSITMRNIGNLDWTTWEGIELTSQNPPMNTTWGESGIELSSIVGPDENFVFDFDIEAPETPGDYVFEWQMRYGSLDFFGERSESVLVTVVESPVASASNDGPHCDGDLANLSGGPDGMTGYIWSGPGGFISTVQNPFLGTATTSMSGSYRLIVTNGYGCVDTATTTLTVGAKPVASASNTGPYCEGQTVSLSALPIGMGSYFWSGPSGFSSASRVPTIADAALSHAGEYTVIVTSVAGCVDTAATVVVVHERPDVEATTNAPVCEGEMLELRANPAGLETYYWLFPDSSIRMGRTHFFLPCTAEMTGYYTAIALSEDGCGDTSTIYVRIDTTTKTLTIESLTADSSEIFEGSGTYIHCDVSGWAGGVSYRWDPMSSLTFPYSAEPFAEPESTTTYVVTVRDSQECGTYSVSDSITITVFDELDCRLSIDTLTGDTVFCCGSSAQLYAGVSNPLGNVYYNWSPSTWLSSHLIRNPICTPDSSIIYTVFAWDDSGCVDTATVSIVVDEARVVVEPDYANLCRGESVILRASGDGIAPFSFSWEPDYAIFPPGSAMVSAFPETTTVYRLILTDSAGCSSEDTITIVVDSLIASLGLHVWVEDSVVILGESTRLHADVSGGVGAIGYAWTPEEPLDIPHLPNPWAEPFESGWFVAAVSDTQGACVYSVSESVFVRVDDTSSCPLTILDIIPNTTICLGESIALWATVDSAVGDVHYLWRPADYLDDPTFSIPKAFPPITTFFWVVASDDSCADSARVLITVDSLSRSMEIMDALATRDSIDIGDSTRLYAVVSGVAGSLIVHWSPEDGLSDPDSVSTWASPLEPTTYTIVAIDSQRCGIHYDTSFVHIHVDTWLGCSLSVVASGFDSICPGEDAHLSADVAGAMGDVAYSWMPTVGLVTPSMRTTLASPDSSTRYTVTAVDDSGCVDTSSVVVLVKYLDESDLPGLSICRGDTIDLDLSVFAGRPPVSWLFSPSIFLDDSMSGSPRCFAETTIAYSVTAIDGEGCLFSTNILVEVDSVIRTMAVALSPDTIIASGGSGNLRAEITGGVGDVSHRWSPALWIDDPSGLTPTVTPPVPTIYYFDALDSQECGVFVVFDSVFVDILPAFECSLDVVSAFVETSICRGGSVEIATSVSGATGPVGYLWSPVDYLDDPGSPSPTAVGLDSSILYTVFAFDDSCTDSAIVFIAVKRLGLDLPESLRICRGESLAVSAVFEHGEPPIDWRWTPEAFLSAPHAPSTFAFPETSAVISLIATDIDGCIDSAEFSIVVDTVSRAMTIEAIASPSIVLPDDSTLLIVNIVDEAGELSIEWVGSGVDSPEELLTWAFPPCSTWFRVTVVDSQDCGSFSITDSVFVAVVSAICSLEVVVSPGGTICRGDSAILSAECRFQTGDVSWSWRPGEFLISPDSASTIAFPEYSTIYRAIATDSAGCIDSASAMVTVRQSPPADAYTPADSIEAGGDIELIAFPEDVSYSYFWSGPAGFTSFDRCPNIEDADLDNSGLYRLSVSDSFGCTGFDSIEIFVYRLPAEAEIYAIPGWLNFEIEPSETLALPLLVGNAGDTILSIDSVVFAGGSTVFDFYPVLSSILEPSTAETLFVTFCEDAVGVYFDTLTIFSSDPDETRLPVPLLGKVIVVGSPIILAEPETLDFGSVTIDECALESTVVSNAGDGVLAVFQLDFPRIDLRHIRPPLPDSIWPGDSCFFVFEYCPSAAASLFTWIEAVSNDTTSLTLLALGLGVEAEGYSINTEIITPNGDGGNDVFRIEVPEGVTEWILKIYDSRGLVVFYGNTTEWDGTQHGRRVPIGTYYYRVLVNGAAVLAGSIAVIY